MSNEPTSTNKKRFAGFTFVKTQGGFSEYTLDANGLTVLHYELPGTGVVTTDIVYRVGARDEAVGESGLAHMLEHMLFKPTKADLKKKQEASCMLFEQETGCLINANTWKDRTTYYFSYPKEHLARALRIEAERMDSVVLTDEEFLPERSNVLSEFDMYNGDPQFALSAVMLGAAFVSHPYNHETIGTREDIEDYTVEKLQRFYTAHYRPSNATLMVFGDVSLAEALTAVHKAFAHKKNPKTPLAPRRLVREPKQEGLRRAEICRESQTNVVALGVKHAGFPTNSWYETGLLFDVLTDGQESVLHKKLVDTGKATKVEAMLEPSSEENLGIIYITLTKNSTHAEIEQLALKTIRSLVATDITKQLRKTVEQMKTEIFFTRGSSYAIAASMAEFVAAEAWTEYIATERKLSRIKTKDILAICDRLFDETKMTIGYFIGKSK